MSRFPNVLRAALILAAANAPAAFGEDAPAARCTLPEIVVTATRTAENPAHVPQSVLVVGAEALREKAPTLPVEALRDESGIWIQKTGAGGGTPIVRGQMGNSVLYLVDGIRINNGRLFSGPNAFFNQLAVGSVGRIEVLKGPGSVQHGSDAMGGVIDVQTPVLDHFPETPETGGRLAAQYGTADRGVLGRAEGYWAGPDANVIAGVSYFTADDVRAGNGERLRDTSLNSFGGFGKAQYRLSDGHVLTLGYVGTVRTDVERHDQSARNQPSDLPRFFTPREERHLVYLKDRLEPSARWLSRLDSTVYYQQYRATSHNNNESAESLRRDVTRVDQDIVGAGLSATTPVVESLRLVYGVDARYERFDEDVSRSALDKATGSTSHTRPKGVTPGGTYDVVDAFALLDWQPVERLRLTAGARFESAHLASDPDAQSPSAGFSQSDLDLDERWNSVTYRLAGLYWLTDELGLGSQVASGYRAPTYSDVLSFGAFTYGVSIPSPGVGPEKCTTWEIGPRFESERVSARLTYFHTWLHDMINSVRVDGFTDLNGNGIEDAGEGNYAKQNTGKGHIQGVEASAEWTVFNDWTLFGSAAWAEGRNEELDDFLRFVPPLNGVAGLRWQATDRLRLSAFVRMAAAQDKVSQNDKTDPARASDPSRTFPSADNPPLRPDYSIPGYATVHVRGDYQLTQHLRVFASGDNLGDKHYREAFSRQDAPGIGATVGIEATF